MKIVQLNVANVKRIRAISITPGTGPVVIGGRNAQGKSSALDAIIMALGGKATFPSEPVRHGEEAAEIQIRTETHVITRKIKADGSTTIKVTTADGSATITGPQDWLSRMVGKLAFDPTAFARMKPAEQRAALVQLTGLDTADLDRRRAALYEERTAIGRDGKTAAESVKAMPSYPDAPAEEVDVADLMAELRAIAARNTAAQNAAQAANSEAQRVVNEANAKRADLIAHGRQVVASYESAVARAADIQRDIDAAEQRLAGLRRELTATTDHAEELKAEAETMRASLPEPVAAPAPVAATIEPTDAIEARIAESGTVNAQVRANRAKSEAEAKADALRAQYADLTAAIAKVDADKAARLAAVQMPVDGLSIGETDVLFNNIPLSQCSQAEQIKIAFAMASATSPELRIALLRDGAFLDSDSLQQVAAIAAEHDMQVWIERVGDGDEGAIIIEDGEVV